MAHIVYDISQTHPNDGSCDTDRTDEQSFE